MGGGEVYFRGAVDKDLHGNAFLLVLSLTLCSDMQCNCMMGLFPEIRRAWLTIDSDIFVWNYEDG